MVVEEALHSHGVPAADVLAGRLDHRLTGLIEGPVDAVVGAGVGLLDQSLELKTQTTTSGEEMRRRLLW